MYSLQVGILQRDCLEFEKTYFWNNLLTAASIKSWILKVLATRGPQTNHFLRLA